MMRVRVFCEEINDIVDIYGYLSRIAMSDEMRKQIIFEIASGKVSMARFTQEAFVECIEEYYEVNGHDDGATAIRHIAQNACVTNGSIVITHENAHGDWIDVDLFGGTGNGDEKNDFLDWCMREKGIEFIYCDDCDIISYLNLWTRR